MRLHAVTLFLATASSLTAANPFQPTISPNGVVNAASYLSHQFSNYGIARGSMFLVFGSALGPVDLVQATTFPLPTSDGLAGTKVLVSIGAYNAVCPMVYTSINQIAAIMPSNAPEGEGSLVVAYQNLASTSVVIRVVKNAFGVFTRNQGGSGPAIAQNFVSQSSTPLNSLINAATPGQTVILWGTGLGPVSGDETSGPLPGALNFLDSLYVGGTQAFVRYAGRSGCCAGVDQIVFDVPQGVAGCYVPVAAVTAGVVSNFGTISVANSGGACDDPLSYRSSALATAQRTGALRTGVISLTGMSSNEVDVSGSFLSADLNTVLSGTSRVTPSLGSCYLAVTQLTASPAKAGTGLNAGDSITVNGPGGILSAPNTSSGGYFLSKSPAAISPGIYSIASSGGSDVGGFTSNLTVAAAPVWSNMSTYLASAISQANPLIFAWTGADPAGYVTVRISSANAIYNSAVQCNVSPAAGAFTIPPFLTRALYASPITVSLTSTGAPASFTASGLDAGTVSGSITSSVQTVLQPAVQ
jgi:uncharacterized protein (TIGR03437 family)